MRAGSLPRQIGITSGHRGLNLQPGGRFVMGGTMPLMVGSRALYPRDTLGKDFIRPRV